MSEKIMFEFKLSLDESNLVLAALSKLPYENSAKLIHNIKTQAEPQIPKVQEKMAKDAAVVNIADTKSAKRSKKTEIQSVEETDTISA
jgi:hypothetical protein